MTITRFAPSPTGFLHVGNLRTAVFNYLIARQNGGQFILRLDDTDPERSTQEYADAIREDLEWLGLTWDRVEDAIGAVGPVMRRQRRSCVAKGGFMKRLRRRRNWI